MAALAAGDLTRQDAVEVRVNLGDGAGEHAFHPNALTFETGKLVKLVIHNPSKDPHYFTSPELASRVFTRKVQVMGKLGPNAKAIDEIKGGMRD